MTAYLSQTALDHLKQAQAELERHLATGPDGRCQACRQMEPCSERYRMGAVFARYERLPRRRAGVTKVGLRRVS